MVWGLQLDKRMQKSNWQDRPLTRAQLEYAALDAHCLIRLWRETQHSAAAILPKEVNIRRVEGPASRQVRKKVDLVSS